MIVEIIEYFTIRGVILITPLFLNVFIDFTEFKMTATSVILALHCMPSSPNTATNCHSSFTSLNILQF